MTAGLLMLKLCPKIETIGLVKLVDGFELEGIFEGVTIGETISPLPVVETGIALA